MNPESRSSTLEGPPCPAPGQGGAMARLLAQFARPTGWLGRIAGWIMAARGSNRERCHWSIGQLGVEPGHRVLEIGFGPGVSIRELARRVGPAPGLVVGVDHSETMLRQASRRNAAAIREGRVRLHRASVEALPRLDGPFDRILSVNSIQFWREPERRLAELRRLLAPGGRIALTLQPRHRGASQESAGAAGAQIRGWLEAAGFADARVERLPLRPVDAVCALATNPAAS